MWIPALALVCGGTAWADNDVAVDKQVDEAATALAHATAQVDETATAFADKKLDQQVGAVGADKKAGKQDDKAKHTVKAKSGLRLRDKPSIKGNILAVIPNGTKVQVLDKSTKPWFKCSAQGKTGYMWGGYLNGGGDDEKAGGKGAKKGAKQAGSKASQGSNDSGENANNASGPGSAGNPNGGGPINTGGLSGLKPGFRAKVERILRRLKSLGWQARVAEGRRTQAQQREKVRKGYSKTMNSYHLIGLAADIIDSRYAWNIPQSHKFWRDLGAAAAAENLTWGGNWTSFKDVAHVQARSRSAN